MYPHERSLVKRFDSSKLAIIGVNSDSDRALVQARVRAENITWRSFWAGPGGGWGRIPSQWGVKGWPKVYVLDHRGVIRHEDLEGDALENAIATLVTEIDD